MKKLLALTALSFATMAPAAFADGGPGCGLGSMVFKNQQGIPQHVLAATTNGSFGNQTFGMTSGTLGCQTNKPIASMASVFVEENLEFVARDMSHGRGEHLDALAAVLGIQAQDQDHFRQTVQQRFDTIVPDGDLTSDQLVDNLLHVMEQDARLSTYLG